MECGMMSKKNFQKAGCITMDIADRTE